MLNHQRRHTLSRPTAAPTATQLRVVLTQHLLPLQLDWTKQRRPSVWSQEERVLMGCYGLFVRSSSNIRPESQYSTAAGHRLPVPPSSRPPPTYGWWDIRPAPNPRPALCGAHS